MSVWGVLGVSRGRACRTRSARARPRHRGSGPEASLQRTIDWRREARERCGGLLMVRGLIAVIGGDFLVLRARRSHAGLRERTCGIVGDGIDQSHCGDHQGAPYRRCGNGTLRPEVAPMRPGRPPGRVGVSHPGPVGHLGGWPCSEPSRVVRPITDGLCTPDTGNPHRGSMRPMACTGRGEKKKKKQGAWPRRLSRWCA